LSSRRRTSADNRAPLTHDERNRSTFGWGRSVFRPRIAWRPTRLLASEGDFVANCSQWLIESNTVEATRRGLHDTCEHPRGRSSTDGALFLLKLVCDEAAVVSGNRTVDVTVR